MLEGTLDSFGLAEVFQLLALTQKTGCLYLRNGGDRGRVHFGNGQVIFAASSSGRLALGRRLVGAGLLTTEQLHTALERQRQEREDGPGTRLGRILVDVGAIDETTLETFVREQIQDAVFDLMRWVDGSFRFDAGTGSTPEDEPIRLSVSVENLIMEGSRRIEEWEQVRRKVPSLEAVVEMAPLPGDGALDIQLKPDEWRLLTVVDGRRTVRDLVELFGQGEFQTCRTLHGMIGAGLLTIHGPDGGSATAVGALIEQQDLLRSAEADGRDADAATPRDPAAASGEIVIETPLSTPSDGEPEAAPADAPAGAVPNGRPAARVATGAPGESTGHGGPEIDEDLVRRLLDGVRGL